MDDLDRASELEEKHRQQALLLRKPELFPCGRCYNCNEKVKPGWIFCDPECQQDWQERDDARRRNG